MFITLYFIVTRLPDSLRSVKDRFLSLDPTVLTVDLLEQHLLAAETSVVAVGAARGTPRTPFFEGCSPSPLAPSYASAAAVDILGAEDVGAASASAKCRSSKGKGGRGGGGGSGSGGGGSSGDSGGSGCGGSGGSGGGRTRAQQLLRCGVAIFDLDYDAILSAVYALSASAEGDCYQCVPLDPGIEAAALGASESSLPGTAPAEALQNFTLDSRASRCFFRDSTTLTPLPTPVPVRLADPSGGPVVARSSTNLPCLAVASPCSCRLLSHQTLLWHHRLGHPSLPRLRGMHSRLLVCGLPRSLPPIPPSPAPPCLPCDEGWQRAAPHSSFPPTTAPLQTLHMDVWGPARVSGQGRERYFLLYVSSSASVSTWIFLSCVCTPTEVVSSPPPSCETFVVGRAFSSLTEVPRTSMIHAAAPYFLWPFAVRYAAHQLNLWPRVSLPETSPTQRWTGEVGDASVFLFYHPTLHHVFPSQDVTFDESVPFYHLFPYHSAPPPPPPLFLALGPPPVDPLLPQGPSPFGVSEVDPLPGTLPVEVAINSGAARGAASGGAELGGVEHGGVEPGGVDPGDVESEGAGSGGVEPGGAESRGASSPGVACSARRLWSGAAGAGATGDTGAGGAGVTAGAGGPGGFAAAGPGGAHTKGTGAASTGGVGGVGARDAVEPRADGGGGNGAGAGGTSAGGTVRPLTERREPASHPFLHVCTARRVPRSRPTPILDTHAMALCPSFVPLRVPLPPPPESSLPAVPDPGSDLVRAASPNVSHLLAIVVTDPSFESTAASALVAELLDFAAACRMDYASALVAESEFASPPFVKGEYALGTDLVEDRQEEFECLAAALPRFPSMLLALEGDPDAPIIPTPHSYAEAITDPYSSQWQTAMDVEMASWKSTSTYINSVPPSWANIGVDYFQTFSPTPKMTTLRVLLHVAAQRDYELHSLDFSTAFLQGNLHEEIWLRRPLGFTGPFPAGTQWSLRRPIYGLRQASREWQDTLRTILAALGFAPSTADPSLFLRTDTSLPPFYVLVYVDDLVFATADTEALTLVKSELQKRHTCTDLGEPRSYHGLKITRDRAVIVTIGLNVPKTKDRVHRRISAQRPQTLIAFWSQPLVPMHKKHPRMQ
ncbi:unnamed protein product [Closterium sp. NIES-54]